MKRSRINAEIKNAMEICKRLSFFLPDFAGWSPEEWKRGDADEMKKTMLGWDVTDYGTDDFDRVGAVLFTLRNGSVYDSSLGTPYCEKVIIMKAGQKLPMHFHFSKTEDIINRNGAALHIRVYASKKTPEGYELDGERPVTIYRDGIKNILPAGTVLHVEKGCSVTIAPYIYHEFFSDEENGELIVGEVSSVNDDTKDNYYLSPLKLTKIEEDEPEIYHLCGGYIQ